MELHDPRHIPVLLTEILELLAPSPNESFLDGTLGLGGHSAYFLNAVPSLTVYGFDLDEEHLRIASERLQEYPNVHTFHDNFANGRERLEAHGISHIDLCLLDLGICSRHVDEAEKGFSFQSEGPLDMRFSKNTPRTAYEVINTYSQEDLADIFWRYGEEPSSRKIAAHIVEQRGKEAIATTAQLASVVAQCKSSKSHRHPATQVFQALRIYVNDELGALEKALETLPTFLSPGGRLAIISYHSLEDRLVKQCFQGLVPKSKRNKYATDQTIAPWTLLTPKPILPSQEECSRNPRARSAKLRILQRSL